MDIIYQVMEIVAPQKKIVIMEIKIWVYALHVKIIIVQIIKMENVNLIQKTMISNIVKFQMGVVPHVNMDTILEKMENVLLVSIALNQIQESVQCARITFIQVWTTDAQVFSIVFIQIKMKNVQNVKINIIIAKLVRVAKLQKVNMSIVNMAMIIQIVNDAKMIII